MVSPLALCAAALGAAAAEAVGAPACTENCVVAVADCNASDPSQLWEFHAYSSSSENSLQLKAGAAGPSTGVCLNVRDFGKSKGDMVWVTHCRPEHPDKANREWVLDGGKLKNPRSGLCATETQQATAEQATRHTVLGDCDAAQKWSIDSATGLVHNADLAGCLAVTAHSVPHPGPPGPGPSPSPLPPFPDPLPAATTQPAKLTLGESAIARSGGPRYASFNFDWHCGFVDAPVYHCRGEVGWNHSSVNFGLDLKEPALVAAAKALAPARLRIGGSQGDCICYDIPAGSCAERMAQNATGFGPASCNSPAFILSTPTVLQSAFSV